jgi:anti-sigma B factor antagonist
MRIQVEKIGDVSILRLQGKLAVGDGDSALREAVVGLLGQGERKLLINMQGLAFVDSAGLGETVACKKRALEQGADVWLVLNSKGKPEEVFFLTCLNRIFRIFYDQEEALASYAL